MKNINSWIFILIIIVIISACNKEENNDSHILTGEWIYSKDYSNTLDFRSSVDVLINDHEYAYLILGDSIEFSYIGKLRIYIKPSKHRFEILSGENKLIIEDLYKTHFFKGEKGENLFLRDVTPNVFIGYWINIEQNDTLIFLTNDRLERPRRYYNDWFDYSASSDSLRLQYSGPDKLLVPEINYGYDFIGDTLLINYHRNYYPNLTIGEKKYLKK